MGVRERVTLFFGIIVIIQITNRHCMPRTLTKSPSKYYPDNSKDFKKNPLPFSSAPTTKALKPKLGKGKNDPNPLQKKSIFKTYNFPETEYPLDNSPRDPYSFGTSYGNSLFNMPENIGSISETSVISKMKNAMKMKRKLTSYKQLNMEGSQPKKEISLASSKFATGPEPIRLLDSVTFPEVQYPLNAMETWVPNYWNPSLFAEEQQNDELRLPTINPKTSKNSKKTNMKLTKATASQYLKSFEKLKEDQKLISTASSKRSNSETKGVRKTATSERFSEDLMTADIKTSNSTNSSRLTSLNTSNLDNICTVTKYFDKSMPIPYKVIQNNSDDNCPKNENINSDSKLNDSESINERAQTADSTSYLLSTQFNPFHDAQSSIESNDTGHVHFTNIDETIQRQTMNPSKHNFTTVTPIENISQITIESAKTGHDSPSLMPSVPFSESIESDNMSNNIVSTQTGLDITSTIGPLNLKIPLPLDNSMPDISTSNALSISPSKMLSYLPDFQPSTSIIIIPINNGFSKPKYTKNFENVDTPMIVRIPTTSLDKTKPNKIISNDLADITLCYKNNSFTIDSSHKIIPLISDSLPNYISISESSYETLPTNSMCYNNDNNPTSLKEELSIHYYPSHNPLSDTKLSIGKKPTDTCSNITTNVLPSHLNFDLSHVDFCDSDLALLSNEPHDNNIIDKLPVIARETPTDVFLTNSTLLSQIRKVTPEILHDVTTNNPLSTNSIPETILNRSTTDDQGTLTNLDVKTTASPPSSHMLTDSTPRSMDRAYSSASDVSPNEMLTSTKNTLLQALANYDSISDTLRFTEKGLLPTSVSSAAIDSTLKPIYTKLLLSDSPIYYMPRPIDKSLSPVFDESIDSMPKLMDKSVSATPLGLKEQTKSLFLDTAIESMIKPIVKTPSIISNASIVSTLRLVDMTSSPVSDASFEKSAIGTSFSTDFDTAINSTLRPNDNTSSLISDVSNNEMPKREEKTIPLSPVTNSSISSTLSFMNLPLPVKEVPQNAPSFDSHSIYNPHINKDDLSTSVIEILSEFPLVSKSTDELPVLTNDLSMLTAEVVPAMSHFDITPSNSSSLTVDDITLQADVALSNTPHSDHSITRLIPTNNTPVAVNNNSFATPFSGIIFDNHSVSTDNLSLPIDEILQNTRATDSNINIPQVIDYSLSFMDKHGSPAMINNDPLLVNEMIADTLISEDPTLDNSTFSMNQNEKLNFSNIDFTLQMDKNTNLSIYESSLENPLDLRLFDIPLSDNIPDNLFQTQTQSMDSCVTDDTLTNIFMDDLKLPIDSMSREVIIDQRQTLNDANITSKASSIIKDDETDLDTSPNDKMVLELPSNNNNTNECHPLSMDKTVSTSPLPITKVLLENVLSDITEGSLSLPVITDIVLNDIPLLVDKEHLFFEILPCNITSTKSVSNGTSECEARVKSLVVSPKDEALETVEIPLDDEDKNKYSLFDHATAEVSLPKNQMFQDIERTYRPTYSLKLPTDKTIPNASISTTKTLLENIQSNINKGSFLIPEEDLTRYLPSDFTTKELHIDEASLEGNLPNDDLQFSKDNAFARNADPDIIKEKVLEILLPNDKMFQHDQLADIFADGDLSLSDLLLDTVFFKIVMEDLGISEDSVILGDQNDKEGVSGCFS